MDEMLAFLRTIAENPGDDIPRLVFADWLEENGHPGRAEFIRLQIELARMDPSDEGYAEKTAKMRRCGVFTDAGQFPFFDHLPTEKCRIGFSRGFIETIDTLDADMIDTSGFDLIPLHTLRTGQKLIDEFIRFEKLERLEFNSRDCPPAKLLDLFGSESPLKSLVQLSLPELGADCLEAGVIPRFDLPNLRNFYLYTDAFSQMGTRRDGDPDDDDYDPDFGYPWGGVPDYLPRNALPGSNSPLERFVWHCEDDSDFFHDEDWYWRGPTMESLLEHLKDRDLKQIEVAVDYDDHENGSEGVIAAPYRKNPLEVMPSLDRITLDEGDTRVLAGSTRTLKGLRVYVDEAAEDSILSLLARPACSELESMHIQVRGGRPGRRQEGGPVIDFPKLKSLCLSRQPLGLFSDCRFPNLVSLSGDCQLETILERKWPNLQSLTVYLGYDVLTGLKILSQSDCFPNLTTLTIDGPFDPAKTNFSFLAECPHMPFLSLIRIPNAWPERAYILDGGALIPVRSDVMMSEHNPLTPYHIYAVF